MNAQWMAKLDEALSLMHEVRDMLISADRDQSVERKVSRIAAEIAGCKQSDLWTPRKNSACVWGRQLAVQLLVNAGWSRNDAIQFYKRAHSRVLTEKHFGWITKTEPLKQKAYAEACWRVNA